MSASVSKIVSKASFKRRLKLVLQMAKPMQVNPRMASGRRNKDLLRQAELQKAAISTVEQLVAAL